MAASDPAGGQKFWFNGVPYQGVDKPGTDTLGLKYWFNGVPVSTVIPAAAASGPFNQTDWSVAKRVPCAPTNGSAPLNLCLVAVVATAPFFQTNFAKPFFPRSLPDVSRATNPNLFKNPLPNNQTDWAKSFRVPHITPDVSRPLNPNLQKNNIPFLNATGGKPFDILGPPTPPQPYNNALYTVAVVSTPFNQTDWTQSRRMADFLPDTSRPLNLSLIANLGPFNQTDWNASRRLPDFLPDGSVSLNINLLTNPIPFNQFDWLKPFRVPLALAQPSPPLNINIFTNPIPFANLDRQIPFDLRGPPDQTLPYNLNLYGVVAVSVPFNQTDFARPFFPRGQEPATDPLNINLFTNPIPFAQFDWAKSVRLPPLPPVPDTLNTNLFTPFPFSQTDWSKPQQIKITQPRPAEGININLLTNPMPFAQVDQSAGRVPRALASPDLPYNQNLYTVTVQAAPFNQMDWSVPQRARSLPQPAQPLNPNLFTNPIPFAQYDWTPARKPLARLGDDPANFVVLVSVAPSAPLEQHSLPFFSTVGQLMGM